MEPTKGYESEEMFVKSVQWNSNEHQGRSFQKVMDNYKVIGFTIMIALAFLFALAMIGAFSYFFNQ